MTDREAFDEIAAAAQLPEHIELHIKAGLFYSLVQEILAKQLEEKPARSYGLIEIGHAAWRNLTPIEQAHTLDTLFTAYIIRILDENRERQLTDRATSDVKTYLGPDDLPHLTECLAATDTTHEDAQVEGIYADSLRNALDEIHLLRHRLAMATRDDT